MRVLVAVPVYNEEKHIQLVLPEIRGKARDVLVVDDGSTDNTPALLRARRDVTVLTHLENRGYGQSLIDAFDYAARHGYDWVITMDCDGQHDAAQLPNFLCAIRKDDADVISGSRYLQTDASADRPPADRQNINRLMTELINSLLALKLTDSFCGFKAFRVAALEKLNLTISGYAFPMQFWVQAANAGLRIREIPVRLIYNDLNRHFGGELDNPAVRLAHYIEVLSEEIRAAARTVRRNASRHGDAAAFTNPAWDAEWQHLCSDH